MPGVRRSHFEILDNLTGGGTVWSFTDPENLTSNSSLSQLLIIQPEAGIVVMARAEVIGRRTHCIDFLKNKHLWTLPEKAWPRFITGDILWLQEPAQRQRKKKPEYETDLVARDLRTGKELWRMNGLEHVMPFGGRLYSWRGRTLTCWAPVAEVEAAKAAQKATAKAAPAEPPAKAKGKAGPKDKGVLKTRFGWHTGPEDENDWREWWYNALSESPRQRLPVSAVLEALRAKFATVNLLHGTIEIYDRLDQYWGRLSVDKDFLPKGEKKLTDTTAISGFRLQADEAVGEILNALLAKRKLKWDVTV
jgi:hypothetical protein